MFRMFLALFLLFLILANPVFGQTISNESVPVKNNTAYEDTQLKRDIISIINKNMRKSVDYFVQGVSNDLKEYFTKKYEKFLNSISDSYFRLSSYFETIYLKKPNFSFKFLKLD